MTRVRYLVGVATLAATIVGGYLLFDLVRSPDRSQLFTLRIEFKDVRGLRPGADVRYRGVPVGSVRRVDLRPDGERAGIELVLEPAAEKLVRYGSRFWIVSPRFLGLTQGASGLDTLIRDSYVSFATGEDAGPVLNSGSQLVGCERPPQAVDTATEPIERGDLLMTLLVPENHDLAPGSLVMFRGIPTGELRSVELAADGTHVLLQLRIERQYRQTVTDRSQFWVARPRLSGALLTGLALQDAAALLTPFIGYYTEPGAGVPVPDGHRAAALPDRPDIRVGNIPVETVSERREDAPRGGDAGLQIVRVFYRAIERDFWSPDDDVAREGSGLLLEDGTGRTVVLTTRSTCDGNYFVTDPFGSRPDIERESIRVALPEGQVLQATRAWTAPEGVDLALLVLQEPPQDLQTSEQGRLDFGPTPPSEAELVVSAVDTHTKPLVPGPLAGVELGKYRGGCVLGQGKVVGILGQVSDRDERPKVVGLAQLPPALRPKQ
ncbi:MAG: MlaD family protein [Planctomycetota bacterium]